MRKVKASRAHEAAASMTNESASNATEKASKDLNIDEAVKKAYDKGLINI